MIDSDGDDDGSGSGVGGGKEYEERVELGLVLPSDLYLEFENNLYRC